MTWQTHTWWSMNDNRLFLDYKLKCDDDCVIRYTIVFNISTLCIMKFMKLLYTFTYMVSVSAIALYCLVVVVMSII